MIQASQWRIEHGEQVAVLAQRGGAIRSYSVAGVDVIADVPDGVVPTAFHGAVLAPWPNRVTDGRWTWLGETHQLPINELKTSSALHGLLAWTAWQLVQVSPDAVTLTATVVPQPGYPFSVRFTVTWSLSDAGLRCDVVGENIGTEPAPFGVSAHPYFVLPGVGVDDCVLTLPAQTMQATDENLHPTALLPVQGSESDLRMGKPLRGVMLDTAFTNLSTQDGSVCTVTAGASTLEVWADAQFGWWQLYTSDYFPPEGPDYRRGIAIEPMSCGPDAFNTGADLIVLAAGASWTGSWGARRTA